MNDRELLEMAARAAGMPRPVDDNGVWSSWVGTPENGHWWDPLTDDGDALRLAVKLHMTVDTFTGGCEVGYDDMKGGQGYLRQDDGPEGELDDFEVVRRAIVRAAAEMGRVE
ncbi:hypothetical protein [Pseudomonas phage HU1]|nr:hypothetical protein [Pseudomonas phage HU1]